jgi:hypothetical protein
VTRVVDPNKLTWVVETTYDVTARRATFQIIPDHYGTKLRCSGEHSFIARGDVTIRRVEAELTVAVPLLGRVVERAITSGLRDHLQTEADLLTEFLEVNG